MDGITLALIILIPTLSLIFGFTVLAYYSIKNWQAEQERRAARKAALEQWLANPTQDVNQWNWVGQKYDSNAFLNYYRSLYGRLDEKDYSGVYVIKNLNNNSYYIGQSIKILRRVKSHLSGKGNGDVYADYKYGAPLEITLIEIPQERLNEIERLLIQELETNTQGYNRTKGNQ